MRRTGGYVFVYTPAVCIHIRGGGGAGRSGAKRACVELLCGVYMCVFDAPKRSERERKMLCVREREFVVDRYLWCCCLREDSKERFSLFTFEVFCVHMRVDYYASGGEMMNSRL